MIRSEVLSSFEPGVEQLLFPYAAEEFLKAGALQVQILKESEIARVIYVDDKLLCYAGVVRPNFLSPPILWFLLGKNITRWSARTFRELTRMLTAMFGCVHTVIETNYSAGKKFAEFCGFQPMGIFVDIYDRRFEYYEVK